MKDQREANERISHPFFELNYPTPQAAGSLQLRYNWQLNCWQVWNYLSHYSHYRAWKWFSITTEQARSYAAHKVPVIVEETVSI